MALEPSPGCLGASRVGSFAANGECIPGLRCAFAPLAHVLESGCLGGQALTSGLVSIKW